MRSAVSDAVKRAPSIRDATATAHNGAWITVEPTSFALERWCAEYHSPRGVGGGAGKALDESSRTVIMCCLVLR
jgi:hypothetical protein